ncbi:MAG TPA: transporter substrate-binding domain-containing protein [Alphaproteobacteria bacterium]|nr:transporter substrate-binding domain-containing protein [Alphaproteobacteria bacterium]
MRAVIAAILFAFAAGPTLADDAAVRRELVPMGKLRVGIGVAQASSAFWTTRDAASGQPRGVTVSLATALAHKLGVPLELLAYNSSGEVTEAGAAGQWDVSFMPVDAERAKKVDFGPNYYLFTSTYLVPAGSPIRTIDEVDREGVRVAGVANTTTIRSAERALKHAKVFGAGSVDELLGLLRDGKADAVALGRESLESLLPKLPGARILDGHFHATGVAVAVPKSRPAALAYVTAFIEEAKASGLVRKALDENGINGPVAPPASK